MKLIDLLSVWDENSDLAVEDTDGNLLGLYDGKNSIPKECNELNVVQIRPFVIIVESTIA